MNAVAQRQIGGSDAFRPQRAASAEVVETVRNIRVAEVRRSAGVARQIDCAGDRVRQAGVVALHQRRFERAGAEREAIAGPCAQAVTLIAGQKSDRRDAAVVEVLWIEERRIGVRHRAGRAAFAVIVAAQFRPRVVRAELEPAGRPARLHLHAAILPLQVVAVADQRQIDRDAEQRVRFSRGRGDAGGVEIAPVAMHVVDAREPAPADRGAVAGRDLAHGRGSQRPVEIRRVAGDRARAVRAQVHRRPVGRAALLCVEVLENALDRFIHRHRQRTVVDGRPAIREIDRGSIARGLIR